MQAWPHWVPAWDALCCFGLLAEVVKHFFTAGRGLAEQSYVIGCSVMGLAACSWQRCYRRPRPLKYLYSPPVSSNYRFSAFCGDCVGPTVSVLWRRVSRGPFWPQCFTLLGTAQGSSWCCGSLARRRQLWTFPSDCTQSANRAIADVNKRLTSSGPPPKSSSATQPCLLRRDQ